MPRVAVAAAQEAIRQRVQPWRISDDSFLSVPRRLRAALARLIRANEQDIILGNSTSYGVQLIASGYPFQAGDEILLVRGDFPADVYPWLPLQKHDVSIRFIEVPNFVPTAQQVADALTPKTRVLCTSWVNSYTGHVLDVESVGKLCTKRGVTFVLNGAQAIGSRDIDITTAPIDALVACGYKWLLGPYATGFCWMRPELRESLTTAPNYWQPHAWESGSEFAYVERNDLAGRRFDVFGTANFLNFMPWTASLEYLLEKGVATIQQYDAQLVEYFLRRVDREKFQLVSAEEPERRSSIVVLSHAEDDRNVEVQRKLQEAGIDIALRVDRLRFSFHLFNTTEEIDRAVAVLNAL